MGQTLTAATIFLAPVLLLVFAFRVAGRTVQWTPLFWAGIAFATYMVLLRSRGVLPEPVVMQALELNWFGKGLSLLGTCCILAFLPRVSFRAAGVRWKQEQHSLRPVTMIGVATIAGATITAAATTSSPNISLEWLAFQATMPGLDEELFMRGLLLLLFHQAFGKGLTIGGAATGWGLWLTTLLFGLLHGVTAGEGGVSVSIAAILSTGFTGFIAGWMRERTGSLMAPVLFHNGFNVALSFV
jgi:membrane protease YdiL (CAAX protease family)